MRAPAALAAATLAVLLLLVTRPARALDDVSLEYFTLESAHFKLTYPHPLESVARRVILLSETIHERVSSGMRFVPSEKTEIYLTDDSEAANGSASSVPYNAIRLYVTSPGDLSALGDYDDWYLGLVTHEYTHILHTGNISGVSSVANAILGKTLSPNSAQPRWIIEGLAVVFESEYSSGGRIRSSLFDMYLRADVLADNIARLDQISANAQRWPYGNLFYLYGSRFLRWVTDIYGPDVMPAVSADYGGSTVPFGVNRAIRRQTGRTYEELYDGWTAHLRAHYAEQARGIDHRGRREGARVTFHGNSVSYPRFLPRHMRASPAEEEVIYHRSDSSETAGLYRFSLGDPTRAGRRDEALVVRKNADSGATFTPDGDILFASVDYWKNLYARHDLFDVARGETSTAGNESSRRRLTTGWRANEPDLSPDGRFVAFTMNSRGTTRLMIADRDATGVLGKPRVLVQGAQFDQAYTPRFSPDGRRIAYSAWRAGGFRDVRIVDLASGRVEDVTHDRSLDLQPEWSPDGKTLYFSSDRTGVFNIYAFDLESRAFRLVTNVHTGAFTPAVSPDGNTLVYVGYTHEGFDLFAMRLDPARFLPAPDPPADRPAQLPEPAPVHVEKYRYNPLPTFAPKTWFFSIGQGYFGSVAVTITTTASDLVGHHNARASVVFDPDAPEPRGGVSYQYSGLPVVLGLDFNRAVVPRTGAFRISDADVPYEETRTSVTSSVSVPIQMAFVDQSASLAYSATVFHTSLPTPEKLDPYTTTTVKPDEGFLSELRVGYGFTMTEGAVATAGSKRGFALRVGASMADESLGSTTSLYAFDFGAAGYIPMPWPGDHTLAIRSSGGISAGAYARRGVFFVGGYDVENASLLDLTINGIYDGAFVLRGYPPGAYGGTEYLLNTFEYRAPLWTPNWGPSTLPLFWRRLDAAIFSDWGGAFNELNLEEAAFAEQGSLIHIPGLHTSVGAELWFALTLANRVDTNLKLGYAYGTSPEAVRNGQIYFLASSAF